MANIDWSKLTFFYIPVGTQKVLSLISKPPNTTFRHFTLFLCHRFYSDQAASIHNFTNYRPQFYFRTTDVTGVVNLPEGTEMCMPGDNVTMTVELGSSIAIEPGLRFAIREGGRTVGSGVVSEIIKKFNSYE